MLKERLVLVWATFIWLARWAILLVIGVAWLATLGFAIYGFYRGQRGIDFLGGCAVALLFLGIWFLSSVNKFYEWWQKQALKAMQARTEQHLDDLLKEYESRVTLNFSESMKIQMASSPTFRVTVMEATKLVLEAIVFQNSHHNEVERETFQRAWRAKLEKFSERIAQEDPLAVEVILKAVEKESQGAS